MEVAIAILLALILVAMVSSNPAAANGVLKVLRWILVGGLLLFAWGILLGYTLWFYEAYLKSTWEKIVAIVLATLIPPTLLYLNWGTIRRSFDKDRPSAIKWTAAFAAYIFGIMCAIVLFQEVKNAFPYIGWSILLFTMFFTGTVLTWRSMTWSKGRNVWFQEPDKDEPWLVVERENDVFRKSEQRLWETFQQTEHTPEALEVFEKEGESRRAASIQRIADLKLTLEAEKAVKDQADRSWSIRSIFWTAFTLSCFGLVGVLWDFGYDYAMTTPMIKGREWMAAGVVILAILAIVGLVFSFTEEVSAWRKRTRTKVE